MRKRMYLTPIVFFTLMVISCGKNELTQVKEAQELNFLISEIEDMAASKTCNDSTKWAFVGYGSRPCGGDSVGYLAYSIEIDTTLFLKKVEEHRLREQSYNDRWQIVGTCELRPEPTGVRCENGEPILEY